MHRLLLLPIVTGCSPQIDGGSRADTAAPEALEIVPGPDHVDFGVVFVGQTATGDFGLRNPSLSPASLHFSLEVTRPEAFSLAVPSAVIGPEDFDTIAVQVQPTEWDDYSGQVVVTDDWGREVTRVGLTVRVRLDEDGDGFGSDRYAGDDCDDQDPEVHPGAEETWYDGRDQDCLGDSDYDADADGFDAADWGGGDCDDADAAVHPRADDPPYDGIDQDCAGDDDFDADGDGFAAAEAGGADCDDLGPAIHPGPGGWGCQTGDLSAGDRGFVVQGGRSSRAGAALRSARGLLGSAETELLIGAPGEGLDPGSVWLLAAPLTGAVDLEDAGLEVARGEAGDLLGATLTTATLRGGTQPDLVAGAPGRAEGDGGVLIVQGPLASAGSRPERFLSGQGGAGSRIATGDLDGDGLPDLIVGAPDRSAGAGGLHWIPASDLAATTGDLPLSDLGETLLGQPGDQAAFALAIGDLNRDGYGDLVVGAPGARPLSDRAAGAVFVLSGGWIAPSGDLAEAASAALLSEDDAGPAGLGASLASPSDLDGDGWRDLVVSTPQGLVLQIPGPIAGAMDSGASTRWLRAAPADPAAGVAPSMPDLSGTGRQDLLLCGTAEVEGQRAAWLLPALGASQDLRAGIPSPGTTRVWTPGTGALVCAGGSDWTGDAHADLALGQPEADRITLVPGPHPLLP